MVPPLFLDVQPDHFVLDMCAAPGSKTFQLLEMIHMNDKHGPPSTGLVVANDVDVQRCHLLIHQTKRMCSPNVIVTNHEAQHFPGLKKGKDATLQPDSVPENALNSNGDFENVEVNEERGLLFDRILCDVPCSGDGTIRKAPDIWKKWNLGHANGLHRLQIQIAMRGVALLRVGGRLVYSTCSLNPVENEAVVGEVMRRCGGCLELLDVSSELPELKRRPGLKTWKVRDKGVWISSFKNVNKHRAGSILSSMFPNRNVEDQSVSVDEEQLSVQEEIFSESLELNEDNEPQNLEIAENEDDEISSFPLDRCLRILPHDQDTGGFFIAVFKKVSPFKADQFSRQHAKRQIGPKEDLREVPVNIRRDTEECEDLVGSHLDGNESNINQEHSGTPIKKECDVESITDQYTVCNNSKQTDSAPKMQSKSNQARHQQQGNWKGVDPVFFLNDQSLIDSIVSFYGIKDTFTLRGHLITRSEDTSRLKRIYYVSESAAKVLQLNFRTGEQMKITSVGLKIFERQGGKENICQCAFRIASEGLPLLLPHMTRQLIRASKEDFKLLLSVKAAPFTAFKDAGFVTSLHALVPGCCVVILDDGQNDIQSDYSSVTAIGCWRGRSNLSLLIPKEEAAQLLSRLFGAGREDELLPLMVEDASPTLGSIAKNEVEGGEALEGLSENGCQEPNFDKSAPTA
ncbi:hypothetical protein KP509_01G076100 [Ceratopteris richardii]|nr:hypothetical protein KP509_01G076100 [Ceratopteris richardii]